MDGAIVTEAEKKDLEWLKSVVPEANAIDDLRCLRALVACGHNIPCLRKALGLELAGEPEQSDEKDLAQEVSDALGAPQNDDEGLAHSL